MTPKENNNNNNNKKASLARCVILSSVVKKKKNKHRTDIGNFGNVVRLMGRGNGSNFSVVLSFRRVGREGLLRYQR